MDNKVNFYTALKDIHAKKFVSFHPNKERIVALEGNFTTTELRRMENRNEEFE